MTNFKTTQKNLLNYSNMSKCNLLLSSSVCLTVQVAHVAQLSVGTELCKEQTFLRVFLLSGLVTYTSYYGF